MPTMVANISLALVPISSALRAAMYRWASGSPPKGAWPMWPEEVEIQPGFCISSYVPWQRPMFALANYIFKLIET